MATILKMPLQAAVIAAGLVITLVATLSMPSTSAWSSTANDYTKVGPATVLERRTGGEVDRINLGDNNFPSDQSGVSGGRLGLHVTGEELAIWRERWADGSSDAFIDARITEEKSRVTNNKNTFMNSSNGLLWPFDIHVDANGYVTGLTSGSVSRIRHNSARARDAAWWALVSNASVSERRAVMEKVRTYLHTQPDQKSSSNIYSQKPWGVASGNQASQSAGPHFSVTHAYVTHLFAYDYFTIATAEGWVGDMTSSQHNKVRNWHARWGEVAQGIVEQRINLPFVNRPAGDYTLTSTYANSNNVWNTPYTYAGGPTNHRGHEHWNNRIMSLARHSMLSAILTDNAAQRQKARLSVRDFLRYAVYPHGTFSDMHRGWSNQQTGLQYMSLQYVHAMTAVDALARAGDVSLYTESTTAGMHDTVGKPHMGPDTGKSFLFAAKSLARYGNYTWDRRNNNNQRYDWHANALGGNHDRLILGNLYYQDSLVRDYYRGDNGMPQWKVNSNGTTDLNDTWAYPAPYLMWAGLEGTIWPYPKG